MFKARCKGFFKYFKIFAYILNQNINITYLFCCKFNLFKNETKNLDTKSFVMLHTINFNFVNNEGSNTKRISSISWLTLADKSNWPSKNRNVHCLLCCRLEMNEKFSNSGLQFTFKVHFLYFLIVFF